MHLLAWGDDASARTVVMVHGNPTWGFLWRKVVTELLARAPDVGLVVPDSVGLGLSSKPSPAPTRSSTTRRGLARCSITRCRGRAWWRRRTGAARSRSARWRRAASGC